MYSVAVVDDEKNISEGIAALFPWKEIGFEAIPFSDPRIALSYMQSHHVDVLLSDIEMPGISGLELCQAAQDLNVIVVFISSHQNYDYFRSAIQYRVEDYLLKPLKSGDILECFGRIREKLDAVNQVQEEKPQSYYDDIRRKVGAYLEEHYRDARLEDAAVAVNLSPAYLSSLLKDRFGLGFSEWLLKIRMEKAADMLRDAGTRTYDIAYYIGYDNPKSFSRAFRNYYGCTPSEYRKGEDRKN